MSKFEVTANDTTYVVEFTRGGYVEMETQGFRLDQMDVAPLSSLYLLFYGGLRKNHPNITVEESRKILDTLLDDEGYALDDILQALVELMGEVFTSPKGKKSKKVKMLRAQKTTP